ncbi:MAG: RodZ domain-containing protein [Pseudomonadota bacterium]|nr:RodZ domain-containing protein [Pseudomonadota bacterium]
MDNEHLTAHPTALRGFDSYEMKLGDELRGHRATLGKSLLDVQRELRIKASYIDAIENCDASVVPNKGFVPGYVRAYARYLGLDAEQVYDRFRAESGFVGQNTAGSAQPRAGAKALAGGLGGGLGGAFGNRLGGGLAGIAFGGAGARGGARPGRDPSLSRSHFAAPVGRARPVGLGVSLSDVASVAVLAGLVCGLGYGAWALVEDIQRVDFAPSNERPELAEAPAAVALPGLAVQAATRAWPAAEDDAGGSDASRREAQLAELYAPREIAPPTVALRDGPIAAIDPASSGLYARDPRVGTEAETVRLALAETVAGPVAGQAHPAGGMAAPRLDGTTGAARSLAGIGLAGSGLTGSGLAGAGLSGAQVAALGDAALTGMTTAPNGSPQPQAGASGIWLVVTDPAWVQVKARDGSILVQRIMEPGERWPAPADVAAPRLRAGNAGGVWVEVNGVMHGPLGRPGAVVKNVPLEAERIAAAWPVDAAPSGAPAAAIAD